jgi:adenylate cyclase
VSERRGFDERAHRPLAAELDNASVAIEIERKWVAEAPPSADVLGEGTMLRQGYLAIDGDVTVRVRIAPREAWLTIKAGGDGLTRTEVELAVTVDEAEQLWPSTEGRRVEKVRHRVPMDGGVAEVDVFAGALDGLCLVEVEFDDEYDARAYEPPAWFGREVTGEAAWSNASLARYGRPPES